MLIEIWPETCCEICNQVVHNHFRCPACKESYAGTSIYGEFDSEYYKEFKCEECNTEFKIVDSSGNVLQVEVTTKPETPDN